MQSIAHHALSSLSIDTRGSLMEVVKCQIFFVISAQLWLSKLSFCFQWLHACLSLLDSLSYVNFVLQRNVENCFNLQIPGKQNIKNFQIYIKWTSLTSSQCVVCGIHINPDLTTHSDFNKWAKLTLSSVRYIHMLYRKSWTFIKK